MFPTAKTLKKALTIQTQIDQLLARKATLLGLDSMIVTRRRMSASGRKAISLAQRRRWRAYRKGLAK